MRCTLYYVWKSAGSPVTTKKTTSTDFNSDVFYAKAVAQTEAKCMIKNSGDNRFGGEDGCGRPEQSPEQFPLSNFAAEQFPR